MSRFNTGNPLGSGDPRDLDDNAKNMDLAMNSDELRWSDRFGRDRKSFEGMEREFDSAQDSREARFNDFIVSSGYQFAGDYGPGIEITEYNQLIRDSSGEFWRVSGQVELPYVTTGAGVPEYDALVPAGDAVLRQDLANPDKGAAMVALKYGTVSGAIKYLTPEMFGAVGDGIADDTSAFQAMFAAGKNYILDGSATYLLTGIELPANSSMYGFGATLKLAPSTDQTPLILAGVKSLVSNVNLDGNKDNAASNPSNYRGADYSRIEHSNVYNAAGHGIWFASVKGGSAFNCRSYSNGKGRSAVGAYAEDGFIIHDGTGCYFQDCEAWDNGRSGIVVTSNMPANTRKNMNASVINCRSYDNIYNNTNFEISVGVYCRGLKTPDLSFSGAARLTLEESEVDALYSNNLTDGLTINKLLMRPTKSYAVSIKCGNVDINNIDIIFEDTFTHTASTTFSIFAESGNNKVRNVKINSSYNGFELRGRFDNIERLHVDTAINRKYTHDRGVFAIGVSESYVIGGGLVRRVNSKPVAGYWYYGDTILIPKGYPDYTFETYKILNGDGYAGTPWEPLLDVASGAQIVWSTRAYKVVGAGGKLGSSVPTHTAGQAANGEVILEYIGNPAHWHKAA